MGAEGKYRIRHIGPAVVVVDHDADTRIVGLMLLKLTCRVERPKAVDDPLDRKSVV